MLEAIRFYYYLYSTKLNTWFYLKSVQMNDWVVSRRFTRRWALLSTLITGMIGLSSKFWASKQTNKHKFDFLNQIILFNSIEYTIIRLAE